MKILLTSGAGYVGSACLRWPLEHGHDPIAYDDLSEGNRAAVPGTADRRRHRRHGGAEAAMHFAARTSVPESVADPETEPAYLRGAAAARPGLCLIQGDVL